MHIYTKRGGLPKFNPPPTYFFVQTTQTHQTPEATDVEVVKSQEALAALAAMPLRLGRGT